MSRRGDNIHKRSDGRWEGRYISGRRDNGKAVYSSVYAYTYSECAEKLKLARCDLLPKAMPVTVYELYEAWLAGRKNTVKQSTLVSYSNLFDNYIKQRLGSKRADSLNAFILNRFADELLRSGGRNGQGLSAVTVQEVMILLRSVLKYGELEYGLDDPAKNISLPKTERHEIKPFDKSEIMRIRNAAICGDISELGILLTLYTGLRIGELCALTWADIDISQQLIHIRKTLFRIKNPSGDKPKTVVVTDSPKSISSLRDVPIPTFMLRTLAKIKAAHNGNEFFLTCSDQPTEPRTYSSKYKTFLKRIGVPYRSFHSLRHLYPTKRTALTNYLTFVYNDGT